MLILLTTATLFFFLSLIVMLLASILAKKTISDREKNSPFECGFEPFNSSRLPFSLRFFLIAIIFLIFDVEIALLFPMIYLMNTNNLNHWILTCFLFVTILILGLYHEWNQGALEWTT